MLAILLWIVVGVLIAALLAVLGLLSAPARISIVFDTQARPVFRVRVALAGGLLPVFSTADKQEERSTRRPRLNRARNPRTAKGWRDPAYAAGMLREMPRLVSRVFRCVRLESVEAKVSFGLPDPADTGIVYGALIPIVNAIGGSSRSHVVLHPDFGNQAFDGRGRLGLRFVPVALFVPMLGFAWATMVLPRISGAVR